MKIYDVPNEAEVPPYNDVCDKKQLIAYAPYTLTPANEVSTNATRLEYPLWDASKTYNATILVEHLGQLYVHPGDKGETTNDLPMTTRFGDSFGSRKIGYDTMTSIAIDSAVGDRVQAQHCIFFDIPYVVTQHATAGMLCIVYGAFFNPNNSKALGTGTNHNRGWVYLVKHTGDFNYADLPYPRHTSNYDFEYLGNAEAAIAGNAFSGIYIKQDPTAALTQEQLCVKKSAKTFFYATKELDAESTRDFPAVSLNLPLVGIDQWLPLSGGTRRGVYNEDPSVKSKKASGDLYYQWRVTRHFRHLGIYGIKAETVLVELSLVGQSTPWYSEEINIARQEHPDYLFGEESYHAALVIRNLPETPNANVDTILSVTAKTASGDKDTYLGLVQPYNSVSLGLMTYAPVVSVINTQGQKTQGGVSRVKNKVSFTTLTPSSALDKIVRALRFIARLSVDTNMPTLFISEYPHVSLAILGYMPTFNQKLDAEDRTSSTISVEEVTRGDLVIKTGVRTGTDESTPDEDPDDGGDDCIPIEHNYPMQYYGGTGTNDDYPMQYYAPCP